MIGFVFIYIAFVGIEAWRQKVVLEHEESMRRTRLIWGEPIAGWVKEKEKIRWGWGRTQRGLENIRNINVNVITDLQSAFSQRDV